jgi:hypothetical protein
MINSLYKLRGFILFHYILFLILILLAYTFDMYILFFIYKNVKYWLEIYFEDQHIFLIKYYVVYNE